MTRSPPHSLYDEDFFAWTQEQAVALRAMPPEALGNRLDVAHLAEEIEDLGKRDLREVQSFLGRLFEHLIKLCAIPKSQAVLHWRSEARSFSISASDAFTPSMRQLIDLNRVWRRSFKKIRADLADAEMDVVASDACPLTLDELLSDDFDVDRALAKLSEAKT